MRNVAIIISRQIETVKSDAIYGITFDSHKDKAKDIDKDTDKEKDKITKRPLMCYTFEKDLTQGYQI